MKNFTLFILLIVPLTLSAQNSEHPLREQYDRLLRQPKHSIPEAMEPDLQQYLTPRTTIMPQATMGQGIQESLWQTMPEPTQGQRLQQDLTPLLFDPIPPKAPFPTEKTPSRMSVSKLKGADTGTPVLDSLHIYRFDSDLHEKKMYHYNEKNYLIRVETFFRVLYLEQPYDLAFFIEEYDWDEAGNKIWDRHLAWDIDNLTADDYLVRHHYEYEFDKAGNQTFESVKEWNYDNQELENKVRQYAEYDQNGDQIYFLRQTGRGDEWLNNNLIEKEFYGDGKLKSDKRLNGDENGNWERGDFHHYEEYVENLNTLQRWQKWSAGLQDWVNHQLTERILDDNGLQDIAWISNWDAEEEEWWHTHILYFTYDEHMILDEIIYVARENPGDEFINFLRSIY